CTSRGGTGGTARRATGGAPRRAARGAACGTSGGAARGAPRGTAARARRAARACRHPDRDSRRRVDGGMTACRADTGAGNDIAGAGGGGRAGPVDVGRGGWIRAGAVVLGVGARHVDLLSRLQVGADIDGLRTVGREGVIDECARALDDSGCAAVVLEARVQ